MSESLPQWNVAVLYETGVSEQLLPARRGIATRGAAATAQFELGKSLRSAVACLFSNHVPYSIMSDGFRTRATGYLPTQ